MLKEVAHFKRFSFLSFIFLALGIVLLGFNFSKITNAQSTGNLALNKPIISVSSTAEGSNPSFAVDGNAQTYWISDGGGAQWLGIDLGAAYTLGTVTVKWGSDSANNYDIEVSSDGINYVPVWSGINGDFNQSINRTTRYLLIRTLSGTNNSRYQLASLEVYLAPPSTPVPTISSPTATPVPTIAPAPKATPATKPSPIATPTNKPTPTLTPAPTATLTPIASPVLTPTPTPTPAPCLLEQARWVFPNNQVKVSKGTNVSLEVTSSGDCRGKAVQFTVIKNGGILANQVQAQTQPANATFINNKARSDWKAEYYSSGFTGIFGPPQYFFQATIVDQTSTGNVKGATTVTSSGSMLAVTSSATTGVALPSDTDWFTAAGNYQRTSWVNSEVRGNLNVEWYLVIDPYIDNKTQVIATGGKIFLSTSKGLYAFDATSGNQLWAFGTEMPLSGSPTVVTVNGKLVAFTPGFDHKIRAIDAATGTEIAGYTPFDAGAGFETSPVVVSDSYTTNTIFATNRDGNLYALDAVTGAKKWSFPTNGAIKFSPAYKNGVVYFASDDSFAYAVNVDGTLKWKSNKLPGYGFSNYWPVIWTDKSVTPNKDYVMFTASQKTTNGLMGTSVGYHVQNSEIPWGGCSTASTSYLWNSTTQVLDCSVISNYYNTNRPDRRNLFIFDTNQASTTAVEYQPYAPVNWQGAPNGNNKYPPIVGGDGVLYTDIAHQGGGNGGAKGWISGWKFGTSLISNIYNPNSGAGDEPPAFTAGGNLIYWGEAINADAWGTVDITKPVGTNFYSWQDPRFVAGANSKYSDNNGNPSLILSTSFNGSNGANKVNGTISIYDGITNMSPVPYNNKLYLIHGNVLFALSTAGGGKQLPMVTAPSNSTPAGISMTPSDVTAKLNAEVQKIVNAGHLRPGFADSGYLSQDLDSGYYNTGTSKTALVAGDRLMEYFHAPGDTLQALSIALPYLSPTLQSQVKTYIQQEETSYPVESIAHIGWKTGALRETFPDPQEMTNYFNGSPPSGGWIAMTGPSQSSITYTNPCCTAFINIGSFPPDAPYAAWKYAVAQGFTQTQAATLFNNIKGKLQHAGVGNDMSDSNLLLWPYILNQYIAGYRGYLELEKIANGWSNINQDTTNYNEYIRLQILRTSNFSKDAPIWGMVVDYAPNRVLNVSRNFMYMTPELGDALGSGTTGGASNNTLVQQALNEYSTTEPYWFVPHYEAKYEEGLWAPLWSRSALFQAKAKVLKQSFNELVKYLDVPAFEKGDLFYIQNLVAALSAPTSYTGPCTITSLNWGSSTASVNTPVSLITQASGDCSTTSATFEVDQNGIGGGKMTDPTPKTVSFNGSDQAITSWTTQYTPLIPLTDPQYYFKISFDGGTTWNSLTSGLLTVTQSPTPTPTATPTPGPTSIPTPIPSSGTITLGETNILTTTDTYNSLTAQKHTLSQTATIQSLSFYVVTAVGNMQMAIYDDLGGKPNSLKAQTAVFTSTVGWNTVPVTTSATLAAGDYWLAWNQSDTGSSLANKKDSPGTTYYCAGGYAFGSMPNTFCTTTSFENTRRSFYTTLTTSQTSPTPIATPTPTPVTGSSYYISPAGNDANSGTSTSSSWGTFDHAWTALKPGDTLYLMDGTYTTPSSGSGGKAIIYPTINGTHGNYITVKALNDGKAILDGQGTVVPVQIGQEWINNDPNPSNTDPTKTPANPFGNYFSVEGLVGKNGTDDGSGAVFVVYARNVTLKRDSGYNAGRTNNTDVIVVWAQGDAATPANVLVEDSVAVGSARKMILAYDTYNNVILRRNFTAWQTWTGTNFCSGSYWPQADGDEIYPAAYDNQPNIPTNSIVENNINFGLTPDYGTSFSPNPGLRVGNKYFGDISLGGGMVWDNTQQKFVTASFDKATCTYNGVTKPASCTASCIDFNNTSYRTGFTIGVFSNPVFQNNIFKDIFAANNGGLGLAAGPWGAGSTNNQLVNATLVNNSQSSYPPVTGAGVDTTSNALGNFDTKSNLKIGNISGGTNPAPGTGAQLQYQYINGSITSNSLWPWPMEERIKAEFANPTLFQANGVQGQVWTNFSVTQAVCQNILLPNGAVASCPTTPVPTATPSPTPTPPPVPCTLASVSWPNGTISVVEGSSVTISMTATGDCTGRAVHTTVRRNIALQPDVDAITQSSPRDITLTGSGNSYSAQTTWTASPWLNACSISTCDPTYFAKGQLIKADGTYDVEVTTDRTKDLTVTKAPPTTLSISNISDNVSSYPNSQVPKYEKYEVTFNVNGSTAKNFQMPYDPNPPAGINQNGINVNAVFTSPSGKTYTQPAFYYQDFDYQVKGNEWLYPNGKFAWKARFAPDEVGTWQYYLTAQDAAGTIQSSVLSFTAATSSSHGFVKVSSKDPRYFEFSDGTYFPALGLNANYGQVDWTNPTINNQDFFQKLGQNGVQLVRDWLSGWAIFGSSWNPWYGIRNDYDGYIPRPGLITNGALSTTATPSAVMTLVYAEDTAGNQNTYYFDACRALFPFQALPAVKSNTKYHIKVRYKARGLSGPRVTDLTNYPSLNNYGFVVKVQNPSDGNWHTKCYNYGDPTNGVKVTPYAKDTPGWVPDATGNLVSTQWSYLEGSWTSDSTANFLPILYLTLENANNLTATVSGYTYNWHPYVYIDQVWVQEDLGGGNFGPNIVTKPSMEHLDYFMERNAAAFDRALDLAHQNNVYFKLVVMEKNEQIENEIGYDGNRATFSTDNNNFYGNYRAVTAVRWLQQAWWRYLQARWGYSPNIQSFEAVNEALPAYTNHYGQVDEMGKYFHCTVFGIPVATGPGTDGVKCTGTAPDSHLVSTSFSSGFESNFFASSKYPNVDFADIHKYIPKDTDPTHFYDTALSTYDLGMTYGAKQLSGAGKPVIRGETGLINTGSNTDSLTSDICADTGATWLHNMVWGGINPYGLVESYWYTKDHIYPGGGVCGSAPLNHLDQYGLYYNFIKNIPLNNGNYQDVAAISTNANIRAWGQKDVTNGKAHLWIANKNHTWNNVVSRAQIATVSGTVSFSGMPAGNYNVSWYDTYAGSVIKTDAIAVDASGTVNLNITSLATDVAAKIENQALATCTLSSAAWSTTTTTQGTPVTLNVSGAGGCSGQTVVFEVRRDDGILGTVAANIQPASVVMGANNQAQGTWAAEYNPLIPGTNPTYYFKATVTGSTIQSPTNAELTVAQAPQPTPIPTATPVVTPTPTLTPTPTATPAPLPTATPTPLPTATNTPTPLPTSTPTPTFTPTPTPVPPPSSPTNLVATNVSYNSVSLSWSASSSSIGIAQYWIVRNGVTIGSSTGTAYTDNTVAASTNYSYYILASDTLGNISQPSNAISVTTLQVPDTTPPSAPTNLAATPVSSSQVNLSWSASTDNVGVTGYVVYRNGVQVASVATTSFGDTGLAAGTIYTYYVMAHDAAGNVSLPSNQVSVTTQQQVIAGVISGKIYDAVTGQSVAQAKINLTINGAKQTYYSDSQGNYSIVGLPAGTYSVRYSAKFYTTKTISVTVVAGYTTIQDVILTKG